MSDLIMEASNWPEFEANFPTGFLLAVDTNWQSFDREVKDSWQGVARQLWLDEVAPDQLWSLLLHMFVPTKKNLVKSGAMLNNLNAFFSTSWIKPPAMVVSTPAPPRLRSARASTPGLPLTERLASAEALSKDIDAILQASSTKEAPLMSALLGTGTKTDTVHRGLFKDLTLLEETELAPSGVVVELRDKITRLHASVGKLSQLVHNIPFPALVMPVNEEDMVECLDTLSA
jgi:hypothetical protein